VSPLLSPALTAKNNEIEQLKARIMELEKEPTSARDTARELKNRIAELEGGTEIKARCQEAQQDQKMI
jgi:septation ring formation regulator EzrA